MDAPSHTGMSNQSRGRRTKVARVIEEYGLENMGTKIEAAWVGENGERTSLRSLADEFNQVVLEEALRDADISPMNFEVTGTYEALKNGSGSERTRAERRLEREGINPDNLTNSFVSHQTIHTYLKKDRKASLPENENDPVDERIQAIDKLQGRVTAVAESAISSLESSDHLNHGEYDVLVDVRTVCPDCGSDYSIRELLRNGGCQCSA